MKIVHTSDWHIGKMLGNYSLLTDQEYYFNEFIKIIENLSPDVLIIAGDIYDKSIPSSSSIKLLNYILEKIIINLQISVIIISGNHDSAQRLNFGSKILEKSGLYIASNLTKDIKKITIKDCNFYLTPYIAPYNIKNLYDNINIKSFEDAMDIYSKDMLSNINANYLNVLVAHGVFSTSRSGTIDSEVNIGGSELINANRFKVFDYVALGHIHSKRTAGAPHIVYSGSPLKYSKDEAKNKNSFSLIHLDKENPIKIEDIYIKPLREIVIIRGSFDEIISRYNTLHKNDYIFIELTDTVIIIDAIMKLKFHFNYIVQMEYINLKITTPVNKNSTPNDKKLLPQLFEEFYSIISSEKLSKDELSYIINTAKDVEAELHDTN